MKNIYLLIICIISIQLHVFSQNCKGIKVEKDEFTDQVTISTPITKSTAYLPISFTRMPSKEGDILFAMFITKAYSFDVGKKGLYVIFEDGSKWIREDVEVRYKRSNNGYHVMATLALGEIEIIELQGKKVKKFKLYIHEKDVSPKDAEEFRNNVSCVMKTEL